MTRTIATADRVAARRSARRPYIWAPLAIAASGLAWWLVGAGGWAELAEAFSSPERFRAWVRGFGAWAPLAFWLAQVAQVIVAPIPGGLTVVAGAVMFGWEYGLALSLSGIGVGSLILFALARRLGRPLVTRLVGELVVARYAGLLDRAGGLWLFVAFLVPFAPDDALAAVAGLSRLTARRFLALVLLGRLPMMAVLSYAAAGAVDGSARMWAVGAPGVLLVAVLGAVYRRRIGRWVGRPR